MRPVISAVMLMVIALLMASNPASADYYGYDTDNDGYMDENEYVDYSYNTIDYDGDGYLNNNEWNDYSTVWYEPYDIDNFDNDFGAYDIDNDGYIDEDEYADVYDSDLFDEWDTDDSGYVDDNEYEEVATLYDDADEAGIFDF